MDVSIIIPLYNEEQRLPENLPTLASYVRKNLIPKYKTEIILVDDGSLDNTRKLMKRYFQQYSSLIKIFSYTPNRGKGHAVRYGMAKAKGKYVFFMDADLSAGLSALPDSLRMFSAGKADAVIASRKLPKSRVLLHQPLIREYMGVVFTRLGNMVLGLSYSDLTCGFKGFTAGCARKIFPKIRNSGWAFDPEILFLLKRSGFHTLELPVTWKDNPNTKVRLSVDIFRSFFELVSIRSNDFLGKYDFT